MNIEVKKTVNAEETKLSADNTKQNNRREHKKFQCTKTGFERCAMQITIAIKVPYHQLGRTRSFDYVASEQADHGRHETDRGRHEAEQEKTQGICGSPWVPIL
ncbi:hypothetical protein T06_231 [Trichinella sp. T6]|nr:hypothetical protein T06_231 [Trichinella sp. T6]